MGSKPVTTLILPLSRVSSDTRFLFWAEACVSHIHHSTRFWPRSRDWGSCEPYAPSEGNAHIAHIKAPDTDSLTRVRLKEHEACGKSSESIQWF
jgi:hypothetical protein